MKVSLGEVCTARSSLVDPNLAEHQDLPHVAPDSVQRDTGRLLQFRSVAEDGVTSGKYRFEPGDVLYSKIRPNLNKVAFVDFAGLCSADMYALDIDTGHAIPEFIAHLLRCRDFLDYATSLSNRANIPKLNRDQLLRFQFDLPPVEEQCRIAAILDDADSLRAKRRQVLAHLDDLAQAAYEHLIGNVDWPRVKLSSITSKVGSGATPRGGASAYKDEGVALIRSMNVHDGKFVWKDLAYLDDDQANRLSNVIVQADDVLLNITGASVARVSRAPEDVLPARVNQHVAIIRPRPGTVHPRVLERHLISPRTKRELLNVAGAGATREAITKAQILELELPSPDKSAQERYLAAAAILDRQRKAADASSIAADTLRASLQSRAFRGEL